MAVLIVGLGLSIVWGDPDGNVLDHWLASGALVGVAIMCAVRSRAALDDQSTPESTEGNLPRHVIE